MHEYVHGWCRDHIGIVKTNDKEGFGMDLELCGFWVLFYFVLNEIALTQIWQNMVICSIHVPMILYTFLYT